MRFLVLVLLGCFQFLGLQATHWSYDGPLGPDHWCDLPDEGNECCGKRQSPIEVTTTSTVPDSYLLNFDGLAIRWNNLTLTNNGHTVVLNILSDSKKLVALQVRESFFQISDTYLFDTLHFHFGSNSAQGSEHIIDGQRSPMEMHVIFYNEKYGSFDNAKLYSDGVIVIGVLFAIGPHNKDFDGIVNAVLQVTYVNQVAYISPDLALIDLLPKDLESSYAYLGSLTTPLCNEAVTWFVLKDKVLISEAQMSTYRILRTITIEGLYSVDDYGLVLFDADTYMSDNFRPTQELNGRTVYERQF